MVALAQAQTRVVIYCRVSDPGAVDDYGMDAQEAECLKYSAAQGWAVAGVHREFHTGTELHERPEMTKVRTAMKTGAIDVVLVDRFDRLSRKSHHFGFLFTEAEFAGVSIVSATEELDDTFGGRIVRNVKEEMAEETRRQNVANMERGKRTKAAQGRPLGVGKPPYGLVYRDAAEVLPSGKVVTRTAGYAEDPTTIDTLRRIFHEADAGHSLRAICRGLTGDGVLPPYHQRTGGTRWGPATLRRILTNPTYMGECAAFRHVTYKAPAVTGAPRKVKRVRDRPEADQVSLPDGCAPTVIDRSLFGRVQRRLEQNRVQATDFRTTRNPEVGILRRGGTFCATCGARCAVEMEGGGPTYRCSGRDRTGCTARGGVRVDRLDPAVWDWLTSVLADEDRVRAYLDAGREDDPTVEDLATLERQRQDVLRQQAKFAAVVDQLEDPEAAAPLAARLDALHKQMKSIARDEADLKARHVAWERSQAEAQDVLATCRRVATDMARLTGWADQRAMVQALRVRVDVSPGGRWVARSEVVPDTIEGSGNLFRTSESSIHSWITSFC